MFKLIHGDCIEVLSTFPSDSIDSIITDPPYGLSAHSAEAVAACLRAWVDGEEYVPRAKGGFMQKTWDAWVPGPEVWREVIRVLKPGGHALIFAGTRSLDLMGIALRLTGFELRDTIGNAHDRGGAPLLAWTFGSGFPKSANISKMIDRESGAVREVVGSRPVAYPDSNCWGTPNANIGPTGSDNTYGDYPDRAPGGTTPITVPVTEAAKKWDGWGTALKPAWEPILLCRKPIAERTVAANVVKHGCGALNIDACRVPTAAADAESMARCNTPGSGQFIPHRSDNGAIGTSGSAPPLDTAQGRWPANLIHDGSDEVRAVFPQTGSGWYSGMKRKKIGDGNIYNGNDTSDDKWENRSRSTGDSGSAARFFKQCADDDPEDASKRLIYVPKASRADREEGLDGFKMKPANSAYGDGLNTATKVRTEEQAEVGVARGLRSNNHPTVKATALMRYLVRLVTPPDGTVCDPFAGSGSTGKAALLEGFRFVGIDQEAEYVEIAKARIEHAARMAVDAQEKEVAAQQRQTELFG
jgi:site-specific DNA-methyltransferase (adenine-specific)